VGATPEAIFDCLEICRNLEDISCGAGELEIANFGYLGCLLSVYNGSPPTEWGYEFNATHSAAPFSAELADSIAMLADSGHIVEGDNGLQLTQRGAQELDRFQGLQRFKERGQYVAAACQSASAIPLPLVTESLGAEPQLRAALKLSSSRKLLDEAGRHAIMAHFAALAQAVPEAVDLLVPAVVWLSYLARQVEQDQDATEQGSAEIGGRDGLC
jgi:hypothetical protein